MIEYHLTENERSIEYGACHELTLGDVARLLNCRYFDVSHKRMHDDRHKNWDLYWNNRTKHALAVWETV